MRKCGIATITSRDLNCGNQLQNYALQQIIKTFGYEPETIRYNAEFPQKNVGESRMAKVLREWRSVGAVTYDLGRLLKKRLGARRHPGLENARAERFRAFSHQHIRMSAAEYTPEDDLTALNSVYDAFVAGSDQIWNPYYEGSDPFYFLSFAPRARRIAYASSFGVSELPPEERKRYRSLLRGMKAISVREYRGQTLVQKLSGRKAEVLPDPTMLLDRNEWLAVAEKAERRPEGGYLLTYFLGRITYPVHRAVAAYAKALHIPVVALNSPGDADYYASGPGEFIDLIAHADLVCTDSFHGCVFSLIFKKPCVVFDRAGQNGRQSMNSRIDTLARDFGILRSGEIGRIEDALTMDFDRSDRVIQIKKEAALSFLKAAFEGIRHDEDQ